MCLTGGGREGDTPRMETGTWTADTWGWVVVGVSVVGVVLACWGSNLAAWWRGGAVWLDGSDRTAAARRVRVRRPTVWGVCPTCGASSVALRRDGQANQRHHKGCLSPQAMDALITQATDAGHTEVS